MATIINASTSAGLVQTADTSGNLNLQSNGSTIVAVSSTGAAVTGTLSASGLITATAGVTAPTTALGNVCGGTYTPTLTNSSNTSVRTSRLCNWFRVGKIVTVSGAVTITTTATGATDFRMSLPIASTFSTGYEITGSTQAAGYYTVGFITNGTTEARVLYNSPATSAVDIYFTFTYEVI